MSPVETSAGELVGCRGVVAAEVVRRSGQRLMTARAASTAHR